MMLKREARIFSTDFNFFEDVQTEQIRNRNIRCVLIDEARTPLIISAPAEESGALYQQFSQIVTQLEENKDYNWKEEEKKEGFCWDFAACLVSILNAFLVVYCVIEICWAIYYTITVVFFNFLWKIQGELRPFFVFVFFGAVGRVMDS